MSSATLSAVTPSPLTMRMLARGSIVFSRPPITRLTSSALGRSTLWVAG